MLNKITITITKLVKNMWQTCFDLTQYNVVYGLAMMEGCMDPVD
jgi:hypothetical protein